MNNFFNLNHNAQRVNIKKLIISIALIVLISCNQKNIKSHESFCLKDSKSAIEMTEEKWLEIYGKSIYKDKPFKAELINDTVWLVYGSLPKGYVGGTPQAEINAKTCVIIKIIHGK